MSRPKSLRPCMWWERPEDDKHPGFFHQIVVVLIKTQGNYYSAHRALVEDQYGQTYTVDVRNVHFEDVEQGA